MIRAAFAAAVAACLFTSSAARPQTPPAVRIGATLSLTGDAASYGAQQRAGIEAAVEEINGARSLPMRIEVIFEDDGSRKERGVEAFQKLIERDKVSAILGPTLSTTAVAADPLAQRAGVPVLAISNTAQTGITDIGEFIWRNSLTEAQVIPGAFRRAHLKLGFSAAALLFGSDDVFTRSGAEVMERTLKELGIRMVGTRTFTRTDTAYEAQLKALLAGKPDVLVVSALADNAAGIVIEARRLGYAGPILGGNGFNSPAFLKKAGAAADGVIIGTAWNRASTDPANLRFLRAMEARKLQPDQFAAQAYTGVFILAEALRLAGGKAGRADIQAGLRQISELDTALGKFSFTHARDASHWPAAQIVRGGKFEPWQ